MNNRTQPTKLFNVAIIIALLLTPILPNEAQQLTNSVAPAVSEVSDQQVPVNRVPTVSEPTTGATTNATAGATTNATAFPAITLSAAEKFHLNASEHFVVINSSGVEPATINVEVGDSVTWHNATGTTVRIKSGTPPDEPQPPVSDNNIFLPIITGGGAQSVASGSADATTSAGGGDIDEQLAPGADFTYTFNSAATVAYYLDRSGYPTGRVLVESPRPTTILESSPANGEDGVAATRETIIEFTRPINGAGVTAANFVARFGSRTLNARLHHSADGKRVTLFYDPVLPASARVQVTVNGDGLTDSGGQKIDGDGDGQPGGAATIDFDTLSVTVVPGTSVCGRVFASELAADGNTSVNVPLQGATITVDGMESTLKATTNSEGNFCLDPAPAGRFFVHIDGRTATNGVPAGAYYPFVGKAWGSVVGQQSSVGNIYLPLVQPGTLQDVSNTEDKRITFAPSVQQQFPEFTGTEIYVPANSLMRDDGSRGGKVGIAPVPPDRLPGELPEGLNFPLVITVQTDGATNFDQPAPICFPNLPDPDTNVTLAAGEKSALWSFNHDTGRFEVVGPMTVSDDGTLVCTDPGVGVPAPGWHGSQPGSSMGNSPPEPDDCALFTWGNAWSLAKAIGSCFQKIARTLKGLGGIFDALAGINALKSDLQTVREKYAAGQLTNQELKSVVESLKSTKNGVADVVGAIVQQNPVTKLIQVAECATSVLDSVNGILCNTNKCTNSKVAFICDKVFPLVDLARSLIDKAEALDKTIREKPIEALCLALDSLIAGLSLPLKAAESHTMVTPDPEILALFDDVIARADPAKQLLEQFTTVYDDIQNIHDIVSEVNMQSVDLVISRDNISNAYYRLQVGETETYGQSSSTGRIEVSVSASTQYTLEIFSWAAQALLISEGVTPSTGRRSEFETYKIIDLSSAVDTDSDGIPDIAESIVRTKENNPDTDNDGIPDGTEVQNGTDPLDGIAARTGVVGAADTPGTALDVCVANNLAAVADGEAGVALFNVFDAMNPTIVAQVDTPGTAQAIACDSGLVAVADKDSGVAIIDTSNPANAAIRRQVALTGAAQAVATVNGLVYAGSSSGQLAVIDSVNGEILGSVNLGEAIDEIAVANDNLYVLTKSALVIYALWDGGLAELGRATAEGRVSPLEFGRKLFVGGNRAYVGYFTGYAVFDVSDPSNPRLQGTPPATQAAIHGMASTGSGELVAVTSFSGPSSLAVSLYDDSDPTDVTKFLTSYDTPGSPRGVALNNGLAYIADSTAGLQVVNYLSYDSGRTAPTLTLSGSFNGDRVEENKLTRVTANAADDVQVRLVEFYVDGALVATDGSYPFEHRFVTPRMAEQATVKLRIRAVDTGGNETWTNEQTLTLVPDATPPRVLRYTPAAGANPADSVRGLTVTFSEAINPSTLTAANLKVVAAGADNQLGTGDDTTLTGGTIAFDSATNTASLTFGTPLGAGIYRATVAAAISDPAGNKLANALVWDFGVGQRIPIGTVIAGEIGVAGEQDVYNFVATPGQRVYFDGQGAARTYNFRWRLVDSSGKQIFNNYLNFSDPGVHILELGGEYTIHVTADPTVTGTYQFQLRSNPADKFNINIGDVIKEGQPGQGAGRIELPGDVDQYTFTATAGQRVYFDGQGSSDTYDFFWQLFDSSGKRIFNEYLLDTDPGVYILELGGEYTIYVYTDTGVDGTYQFQMRSNPPDEFTINIGDIVKDGQPGARAGRIELPGDMDKYTFTATAGQRVYFDGQGSSDAYDFFWQLFDSSGKRIFNEYLLDTDPGVHNLELGGTYTIYVFADTNVAGTYQFQLRSNPADKFNINIGDVIKEGQPGARAGRIELPGDVDQYTFTATAGQRVYFDGQGSSDAYDFFWQLFDSTGKRIFNEYLLDTDPGVYTLELGGTYTIYVFADTNVAGTYQFQLRSNPPDEFTIAIGDTVKDGQPGAGAGRIEEAGDYDVYRFSATPGQAVYFDGQGSSDTYDFYWQLFDANNTRIFSHYLLDSDPGVYNLALGGEYTIHVFANANIVGTYQFQIRNGTATDVDVPRAPEVIEQENTDNDADLAPLTAPPTEHSDATLIEEGASLPDESSTIYLPLVTNE